MVFHDSERRQWEARDKEAVAKIVKVKTEAMKKQVVDGFGPKLDAMVLANKQAISARKDDLHTQFLQLRKQLALDFENEMKLFRDSLEEEYKV